MGRIAEEIFVVWLCLCCAIHQTRGTDCERGFYGENCNILCSAISHRCTECTQDGRCTACIDNLKAPTCTVCEDGYYKYGSGCDQCSSYCKDRQCDPDTGSCNECPAGQYGALCQSTCSSNCTDLSCDRSSGKCHSCEEGYHGDQCSFPCSTITGRCTQCAQGGQCTACSGHLQPPNCSAECEAGLFGENCSENCGRCHGSAACHHVTGHCQAGCAQGFTGPLCVQREQEDESSRPALIVGVVAGVLVAVVVIVAVIVVIRRRRRAEKTKCDDITWERTAKTSCPSHEQSQGAATVGGHYTLPSTDVPASSSPSKLDLTASDLPPASDSTPGLEENVYCEIVERENPYDQLNTYSNEAGDTKLYSALMSRGDDVTAPTASPAYVNMAFKK